LVNNAGVMPVSPLIDLKIDDWNKAIDINIRGVLHGIAAVLPHMSDRGSGQIINIGSVASLYALPNFAVYCATKFAVKAISESLRKETLGKVRVTTIYPGAVESELIQSSNDEQAINQIASNFSEVSFISPTAISNAVHYAIAQPKEVAVNEIVVRPANQDL
jgi:NADP-dependent 3-hydroxy acid dehydrogenase YdfG